MATRTFALTGVASLALAGAMIAAMPSFAQDFETQQTDRLNVAQTTPSPNPADRAAYDAALAQHNQAQAHYDAQLRDYQAKQRAYTQEQQNYNTRAQAYGVQSDIYQDEAKIYDYDRGVVDSTVVIQEPARTVIVPDPAPTVIVPDSSRTVVIPDAERTIIVPDTGRTVVVPETGRTVVVVPERDRLTYPGGHERLLELATIDDPDRDIANMPVEDRRGNIVGHFVRMTFQDNGIPKAVIALNNRKNVVVEDYHFRYDPDEAVVVADLSFDELDRMPARF